MQKFPTLNTSVNGLVLVPLQEKHLNFLVSMLSKPSVQKTLFRTKTTITADKERASIEKMYANDKPSVITYILTQKKLLSETYIGYVKIKLIDWSIHSCYVSIAIDDVPQFRGKGYAKATYDAFFPYLYSLGLKKIYGRTYENNIPTIKLNYATGFRLIGRQKHFITYPDNTSLDALLFEKLHPEIAQQMPNKDMTLQQRVCHILDQAINTNSASLDISEQIPQFTLPPMRSYLENIQQEFDIEMTTGQSNASSETIPYAITTNFLKSFLPGDWHIVTDTERTKIDYSSRNIHLSATDSYSKQSSLKLLITCVRYDNAFEVGFPVLGYHITQAQKKYTDEIIGQLLSGTLSELPANFLHCNGITQSNEDSLRYLFLGTSLRYDWSFLIKPIIALTAISNNSQM